MAEDATHTYRGTCHCGQVAFEVDVAGRLAYAVDCNCSLCRRKGALWHRATDAQLRIVAGEADLVLYQFNTKTAKHYFCRHCGIHALTRPRLNPTQWAANVRCIDGIDIGTLEIRKFDGAHWEEAAAAFRAGRAEPAAG